MVRAICLAAPDFSKKMPMIQPKPMTTPILAMVLPKPLVTVLTQLARVSTTPPSGPKGIASTAIRMAEIMRAGKGWSLLAMMRAIITMMPMNIARTGLSAIRFTSSFSALFLIYTKRRSALAPQGKGNLDDRSQTEDIHGAEVAQSLVLGHLAVEDLQ